MDKLLIRGGKPLSGTIAVSGAKNATLPAMAASLLIDGKLSLSNVPHLKDVTTMLELLGQHGAGITIDETMRVEIDAANVHNVRAPYKLVSTMRASVLVMGPLLARFGRAEISLPGGCAIGSRPIDLHLRGFEAMGAEITLEEGYICACAKSLLGAHIVLDLVTVTGTENLMMAATLARGRTVLENAACEPEIVNLAECLNRMGARIQGAGTSVVTIDGVASLRGAHHAILPDRIETATYMVAAALTRGHVTLTNTQPSILDASILKLRDAGVAIEEDEEGRRITVSCDEKTHAIDIETLPYPGFPTDMQAQMMVLMAVSRGTSVVTETIFENRFMHVSELHRMGADIRVRGHTAIVRGVDGFRGAPVMATDLRASASLVLAGLAARDKTVVSRVYHIDRGYERIEEKLMTLGADIQRVGE